MHTHTQSTFVVSSHPIPNYKKRTQCLKVNLAEKYTFYYLTMLGKNIYNSQSLMYPEMNKSKRKGKKNNKQVSIVTSCRGLPTFGQEIFEEYGSI